MAETDLSAEKITNAIEDAMFWMVSACNEDVKFLKRKFPSQSAILDQVLAMFAIRMAMVSRPTETPHGCSPADRIPSTEPVTVGP